MICSLLAFAALLLPTAVAKPAPLFYHAPHPLSLRQAVTPPKLPTISSISFSGNGCPRDEDGTSVRIINGAFNRLTFALPENFTVQIPGSITTRTVNCQAHLQATGATPGWQVGLSDVWLRGHKRLEQGASLNFYTTNYYSQNAADTTTTVQSITTADPVERDITIHAAVPSGSIIYSPCTGADGGIGILNINARVAFTSNSTEAEGYFGSTGNSTVIERLGFAWRQC